MFEYNPAKDIVNVAKDGISFEAAQALWRSDVVEIRANDGEADEARWAVIGLIDGRYWTAIVTYRGRATRLISVRRSRLDEVELYENQNF